MLNEQDYVHSRRFMCVECKAELCLDCFGSGAEGDIHRNTHSYRILDHTTKCITPVLPSPRLQLLPAVSVIPADAIATSPSLVARKLYQETKAPPTPTALPVIPSISIEMGPFIVALTASAMAQDQQACADAGMNHFVVCNAPLRRCLSY